MEYLVVLAMFLIVLFVGIMFIKAKMKANLDDDLPVVEVSDIEKVDEALDVEVPEQMNITPEVSTIEKTKKRKPRYKNKKTKGNI